MEATSTVEVERPYGHSPVRLAALGPDCHRGDTMSQRCRRCGQTVTDDTPEATTLSQTVGLSAGKSHREDGPVCGLPDCPTVVVVVLWWRNAADQPYEFADRLRAVHSDRLPGERLSSYPTACGCAILTAAFAAAWLW